MANGQGSSGVCPPLPCNRAAGAYPGPDNGGPYSVRCSAGSDAESVSDGPSHPLSYIIKLFRFRMNLSMYTRDSMKVTVLNMSK